MPIADLQFVLQELMEGINCSRVIITVDWKIRWFFVGFSLGFTWQFKGKSHLLLFHYLCSSLMYIYVYIDLIYSCLYMWSLSFPANCCHKALGWNFPQGKIVVLRIYCLIWSSSCAGRCQFFWSSFDDKAGSRGG